ncbi:hypothetical protein EXS62_03145 [Candidatus Kaiserbacteria bacterium]|nr:hypothetical protein [Candidatus Kaiserbacteria bacterium]
MLGPNATLATAVTSIISLINYLMPLLAGIALLVFFWGIIRYLWSAGDSHSKVSGREAIVWGLVALFVIFSLWGILSLACSSLVGSPTCGQSGSATNNYLL